MKKPPITLKRPLLRTKNFEGLQTQLGVTGLEFSENIGLYEREASCPEIGATFGDTSDYLTALSETRQPSKVVLNPKTPSAQALLKQLKKSQKLHVPSEQISIAYGLPETYDRSWKREIKAGDDSEGQFLVLVIFDPKVAIGYFGIHLSLSHCSEEHAVYLHFVPALVYVDPSRRGEGFGLDLSIATGQIAQDILVAAYRAVPPGTTIFPCIYADYESEGGENVTAHLNSCLELQVDMLNEFGKRMSIKLQGPDLDAGY